ncbi:uncharacterized protein LOC127630533 isoform X47 [Xyrauchen texanus]|uniref:uncharacterized protein LOC127630533 isoform X44 n=1 Tax=Xyrauchen texanus TaxID=154827 RepID=UPI00224214D4|nr:uncharacterized protein LOC127630533 isoform X44 [Xyrauchen texanus]XP_051964130.1 uncharacterized protein LOC127630533 isoform X47 [Xyrauchen texanus]
MRSIFSVLLLALCSVIAAADAWNSYDTTTPDSWSWMRAYYQLTTQDPYWSWRRPYTQTPTKDPYWSWRRPYAQIPTQTPYRSWKWPYHQTPTQTPYWSRRRPYYQTPTQDPYWSWRRPYTQTPTQDPYWSWRRPYTQTPTQDPYRSWKRPYHQTPTQTPYWSRRRPYYQTPTQDPYWSWRRPYTQTPTKDPYWSWRRPYTQITTQTPNWFWDRPNTQAPTNIPNLSWRRPYYQTQTPNWQNQGISKPTIRVFQQVENRENVMVMCKIETDWWLKAYFLQLSVKGDSNYILKKPTCITKNVCMFNVTVSPPVTFTCVHKMDKYWNGEDRFSETYMYSQPVLDCHKEEISSSYIGFSSFIVVGLIIITAAVIVATMRTKAKGSALPVNNDYIYV